MLHLVNQITTVQKQLYCSLFNTTIHLCKKFEVGVTMSTGVEVPYITLSKAQKAIPTYLLKKLRATAAVVCYDGCLVP